MIDLGPLVEYETVRVKLDDRRARKLADAAGRACVVLPDPEPGWWLITAQQYVGSVVVDDVRLLVRPKIRPENLFLLLEVGLPEHAWRSEAFDYAVSKDLLPSVVSFFARTLETTLARGVFRTYRERNERLVAMRGRIDHVAQLRRTGVVLPVACRYDDFTSDVLPNQYLKAAVRRALRVPAVPAVDRRRLMHELATLEDVSDLPIRPSDLDNVRFTRLNGHYEPALRLARLLLENLTLEDQRGRAPASSFLVDMNDLFQRFVTERLRRALRGRLEVRSEPTVHLGERQRVLMKPDLEFRRRGRTTYVADIKYKLTADASARTADYYQLLAYTTALDLPEGVLIYCLAEGGAPHSAVTVRNAGTVLHTRAIDLTGTASAVAQEIESLADWIAERSTAAVRA